MEFHLRDATRADLGAINEIYNHYVLTCTCTYQEMPDTADDREAWFKAHGPEHPVIVAEAAGEVVAWGSLSMFRPARFSSYRYTVENSVYVRHDMLGQGIGQALLAELVHRAKDLGYRSIIAVISADQAPSVRLHENFGFTKAGHLSEVGNKFGRWLDVVFLQKKF